MVVPAGMLKYSGEARAALDGLKIENNGEPVNMVITGNETEAFMLLLEKAVKGLFFVILVGEEGISYFIRNKSDESAGKLKELEKMEQPARNVIAPSFCTRRGRKILCDPYDTFSHNKIFKIRGRDVLIRLTGEDEKLKWMLDHREDKENFAWPKKAVYQKRNRGFFSERRLVGYEMAEKRAVTRMDEIFVRSSTEAMRLELCLKLLKKILFLHMQGILVTDYNMENFQIEGDGSLFMLDCIGYTVHNLLGYNKGPEEQMMRQRYEYKTRSDVIRAEYEYVRCVIYCILSNGIWPYDCNGSLSVQGDEKNRRIPAIAKEILGEAYTPYKILCAVWDEYDKNCGNELIKNHLKDLNNRPCEKNLYLKRCPVLILVENSSACREFIEEMTGYLRDILRNMRKDALTLSLSDILVLTFAGDIHSIGWGRTADSFRGLLDLQPEIESMEIYPRNEGAKLGRAISRAIDLLDARRSDFYKDAGSKMPTLILLSRFQSEGKSESRDDLMQAIENLNQRRAIQKWNVIRVKFGGGEDEWFGQIKGEDFGSCKHPSAVQVVNELHYSSSLIMTDNKVRETK